MDVSLYTYPVPSSPHGGKGQSVKHPAVNESVAPVLIHRAQPGSPSRMANYHRQGALSKTSSYLSTFTRWRRGRRIGRRPHCDLVRPDFCSSGDVTTVRWVLNVSLAASLP
jgi:hypothetical protein